MFTSEQNFIWILVLQTMLWNFKHVKLGQILTGYKTGFVRPGHILRIRPSELVCENDFSSLSQYNYLPDCCVRVTVLLEYFDLFLIM